MQCTIRRADGTPLHQAGYATGSRATSAAATFDGLLTGTRYAVTAKATDAGGRTWTETGTFRTRSAVATVTFHKLVVLEDGDKVGRGELAFDFRAGDTLVGSADHRRLSSGDTFVPRMPGTTRPGIWATVDVDGLQRALKLDDSNPGRHTLLLTRIGSDPVVIVASPVSARSCD